MDSSFMQGAKRVVGDEETKQNLITENTNGCKRRVMS